MLGEEIYEKIKSQIAHDIKINEKIAENICSFFPTKRLDVYCLPGYGWVSVNTDGDSICQVLNSIKEKYSLLNLTRDECYEIYEPYVNKLRNIKPFYTNSLREFCDHINPMLIEQGINFQLNTKMLLLYLNHQNVIEFDFSDSKDLLYKLKERGERNGFLAETKDKLNGDKYSKLILANEKACLYLIKLLDDIFYWFYGFNRLNEYKFKGNINFDISTNNKYKYLLIFDVDATIFDTDYLRKKRRRNGMFSITIKDLKKSKLIGGFNDIFFDENSLLYLKKNKVIFITSSSKKYSSDLLNLNRDLFKCAEPIQIFNAGNSKIQLIKEKIDEWKKDCDEIIAFGDDEKDALIYSTLLLPYYIVNNYYGYGPQKEIIAKSKESLKFTFRRDFLYDILDVNQGTRRGFLSNYFDDIIVYYRRYYDKTSDDGNCPRMKGRTMLPKLNHDTFGSMKGDYVREHIKEFSSTDLQNIQVTSEVVFAKVPGSSEETSKVDSPTRYLLDELGKLYGEERNYHDLLLRKYPVSQSHGFDGASRDINKQLKSIYVNENRKIKGKIVYLFDDVVTSGASMMACVELLYRAEVGHVVCFCLGRSCPGYGYKLFEIDGGSR